jgi:microcystin degradation protein MlrC
MPVDERGRLEGEPFTHRVTKDGRVLVSFEGRQVSVVAGQRAARLIAALRAAASDPAGVQLLLAKATGHFKHGTER